VRLKLPFDKITVDPDIQPRELGLDQSHVDELADAYRSGNHLLPPTDPNHIPPPTVWNIGKSVYKLSQGFHRTQAAFEAGLVEIEFEVKTGTELECAIDALCGNQQHGLKRTNADKRRAVDRLLELCPTWSVRKVSEAAGVSVNFVAEKRNQVSSDDTSEPRKVEGKDGKTYTVPQKKPKAEKQEPAKEPEQPAVHTPGEKALRDLPGFPAKLADKLESHGVVTLIDLGKWKSELPRGQDENPANLLRAVDRGHSLQLDAELIHKGHDSIIDYLWLSPHQRAKAAAKEAATDSAKSQNATPKVASATPEVADEPTVVEQPAEESLVDRMGKLARTIDGLVTQVETWKDDPLSYCVPFQQIIANLKSARSDIWATRPCHTCPYCSGKGVYKGKECTGCKAKGMVPRHVYSTGKGAMGK
jgi:predicted flap endonuclease-1-like 5' DNA nuclease